MKEERLTSLTLLTLEREEVLKLEETIEKLIEEFCTSGSRRILLT